MKAIALSIFCCLCFTLAAQPTSITYLNCVGALSDNNDTYVRSVGNDVNGCPCYDGQGNNGSGTIRHIFYDGATQWFSRNGDCASHSVNTGSIVTTDSGMSCDISTATLSGTITGNNCTVYFSFGTPAVPTLSQWMLIILALILIIGGVVAVRTKPILRQRVDELGRMV